MQVSIGQNIRMLRKERGLTLAELATACNCSPSLLSQIETETASPSLGTLRAVSEALGVSISRLVLESAPAEGALPQLMKPGQRKVLSMEGGVQFQLLSRGVNVPFEFILNEWPPGGSTGEGLYTHQGAECGLVLQGELEVEVSGQVLRLSPGDSVTLSSEIPHRITNVGEEKAVAVWVNSMPWVFTTK